MTQYLPRSQIYSGIIEWTLFKLKLLHQLSTAENTRHWKENNTFVSL